MYELFIKKIIIGQHSRSDVVNYIVVVEISLKQISLFEQYLYGIAPKNVYFAAKVHSKTWQVTEELSRVLYGGESS